MRVAILSPELPVPPAKGGAIETGIYDTVRFMPNAEVIVLSVNESAQRDQEIIEGGVRYLQLAVSGWQRRLEKLLNRVGLRCFSFYGRFTLRAVMRRLAEETPDIIEVRNHFYWIPMLKRRFPKSRLILKMHNDFLFYYPRLEKDYRAILRQADHILVISDFLKQQIVRHSPESNNRITVIHEGVNCNQFQPLLEGAAEVAALRKKLQFAPEDKVILYVGRITQTKGVHVLLQAFKTLAADREDVKLLIVGSSWFAGSSQTPYIQQLAAESREMGDKIRFTGYVPHNQLNNYYNLAHACVVPSIWGEPFGLINLESMAAGCAVVASNVGGIPEIITNRTNGLLVKAEDAQSLAAAMAEIITDGFLRARLVEGGQRFVARCGSWSRVAVETQAVYDKLMGSTSEGPLAPLKTQGKDRFWRLAYPKWNTRSGTQEGYSVLVMVPGDLPVFLRMANQVLHRQAGESMKELLVIPDRLTPEILAVYEQIKSDWPKGMMRLVKLKPLDRAVAGYFNSPFHNCWLQFIRGVEAAKCRTLLWHDADLFIFNESFLQNHYRKFCDDQLSVLGVSSVWDKWFLDKGMDHMVSTWEMMMDAQWVRQFTPWQQKGYQVELNGERHKSDITLVPQTMTPPQQVGKHDLEDGQFVHFNHGIATYRKFQNAAGPFKDEGFRLLLIRMFVELFDPRGRYKDLPGSGQLLAGLLANTQSCVDYRFDGAKEKYAGFRQKLECLGKSSLLNEAQRAKFYEILRPFDEALSFENQPELAIAYDRDLIQ